MRIILKNKETLLCEDFEFSCSIGKNGTTLKKFEGDKKHLKAFTLWGPFIIERIEYIIQKLNLKKLKLKDLWVGAMM